MELGAMADAFQKLYLHEKSAISLEQLDPEYVLHLDSQSSDKFGAEARLAATSSNYSVRLYSRHNLATIGTIKGHENVISGVRFAHHDPNILYTASQDKTLKSWDLRTNLKRSSITFEGYKETNNVFTAFDIGSNDRLLCSGTEGNKDGDCHLIFWDCRNGNPLGVYSDCHQDDVTQVHFHPDMPDKLITSSTDGLVNVFDVGKESEDDALLTSLNAECAVAQIGWCGQNRQRVYCMTTIETLHIWDTSTEEFETLAEMKDVRDTYTGADVDYMVNCFTPDDSDLPMVLLGNKKGTLHIAAVAGNELNHCLTLDTAHKDIVRCLNYDAKTRTLVTGGEDAMLCLWSPQPAANQCTTERKTSLKVKTKSKLKKDTKPF